MLLSAASRLSCSVKPSWSASRLLANVSWFCLLFDHVLCVAALLVSKAESSGMKPTPRNVATMAAAVLGILSGGALLASPFFLVSARMRHSEVCGREFAV